MINLLVFFMIGMQLDIPDSIFLPTNALKINPPRWEFVLGSIKNNYLEIGYHTDLKLVSGSFAFSAMEDFDFNPYVNLNNRYFVALPYFSVSHGVNGIYRDNKRVSVFLRDTVDFYFSLGRIVPNITFLPGVHYFRMDTIKHVTAGLPASMSVVYSGSDGVLTYLSVEGADILKKSYNDVYRAGVGIMGSKKFVSLGLTSGLIPEFNLKVLVTGGAYIDVHYGYDIKTPDIFSYLYPDGIEDDSVLSIMEKRFRVLVDKKPFLVDFTYAVPDTLFPKSIKVNFVYKSKHLELSARYFKLSGNSIPFLSSVYMIENPAVSRGRAVLHIPLWQGISYHPFVEVYKIQDDDGHAYNLNGRLEYNTNKIKIFWEHSILSKSNIQRIRPDIGQNERFYTGRRFKIGAAYSF